ncbi:hypothetical protein BH10PSE7_BH10PSE7_40380 [soil metagenome]
MIKPALTCALLIFQAGAAHAFEEPVIKLNSEQMKALGQYFQGKGEKVFAAGPEGQFSAQTGYLSASVAVREALKACDQNVSHPSKRCVIIAVNGAMVSAALQYAQAWRIDESTLDKPLTLGDLSFDVDAWQAYRGLAEKQDHKAFAISLKGSWARSWEASSADEAEKEALAACNKKENAVSAPCFIAKGMSGAGLAAEADLTVAPAP